MRFLVVFACIFRFFASRFIRFLHRQFLKLFDECDDRYASWLERSRIALIDIQKELSKSAYYEKFQTWATYGAEALPLEEDVISVFDDLVNHVAVFEVLRHIFRFFSMLAFMVVRVHQLWSEYGLSANHWKALKKFYLTVCG